MPNFDDSPDETFKGFWEDIVGPENNLNVEQIKKELHDFACLIDNISKVYSYVTDGKISKPNTDIDAVFAEYDQCVENAVNEAIADHEDYLKQWVNVTVDPNTVFIFCFDEDTPKAERQKFKRTWEKAKKQFPPGTACLIVPKNIDLTRILEKELGNMGWYKK